MNKIMEIKKKLSKFRTENNADQSNGVLSDSIVL